MTRPVADNTAEAERLKQRGNALKAEGKLGEAEECYRRAIELDPSYAAAIYNLGVVLQDAGRLGDAEECFRRCRALDAADRDAIFRLGLALAGQGRHADAAEAYGAALALDPENPLLWLELGRERRALNQTDGAIDSASRAVEIQPDFAEARNLLGTLLQDAGRFGEAIAHYERALALSPDDPGYHNNLGCALGMKGAFDEAIVHLCRAVALQPDHVEAHTNLGNLYSVQGRHDLAARSLEAAHSLTPASPAVTADLLFELRHLCDWPRLNELSGLQRRYMLEKPEHPVGPFGLLSIPSSRAEQLQCARNQARRFARLAAADRGRLGFKFSRARKARLRIGYLSSDLQAHATAYLMAELFELHGRDRFEVIAYSYAPDDGSAMRARLLRAFDRFVDIAALSHVDAARVIHGDGVDILLDLKGYTANARTEILALRPAPIQVSFVGYPGTMGDFADYLVGDRVVTPPAHAAGYSEKIVRLPGCYLPNDRKRAVGETPSRRELGLPEDAVVFFCFNQPYKILPDTFSAWMRILDAAPRSVLWLLDWNPEATRNLQREAASRGVDPARLIFAPLLAQREHLGRTAAADLLLDTLPYNAHTVASDALWCGVPVLTCPGETFASRVAASQLTAAGMPEMIMPSMAEYEARAVRLAREPAELAALRRKLAQQRNGCALFDTPAFVRSLERGFTRMWDDYAAGRPLSDIDL